jgi:hypothetical protein
LELVVVVDADHHRHRHPSDNRSVVERVVPEFEVSRYKILHFK